jgi:hypothetical protein
MISLQKVDSLLVLKGNGVDFNNNNKKSTTNIHYDRKEFPLSIFQFFFIFPESMSSGIRRTTR